MEVAILFLVFLAVFSASKKDDKRKYMNYQQMMHSQQAYNQLGQPVYIINQTPYPPYGKAVGK